MRIARIAYRDRTVAAVVDGDAATIVGAWSAADPFAIAAATPEAIRRLVAAATETVPLSEATLLPPAGPLAKIVCLGVNYRDHAAEIHSDLPANPSLFTKFADALVGHETPVVRPRVSTHFDYEGEIAVVIGKGGRHIAREDALGHVFGYTIMLDGSVRDYQKHSVSAGKNFRHSGALGPWIVTADEIPDPTTLALATRLNGETVQSSTADLMLYDIPTAIAYVSQWTPLAPGDVIATGTPGGVGARRSPPLWMKAGDRIEVEVSAIGILANPVEDEG